jgi:hypothetical protein
MVKNERKKNASKSLKLTQIQNKMLTNRSEETPGQNVFPAGLFYSKQGPKTN